MPRQDGRIEQGQSLKSAISARAWNRAQDAADIVLGSRYGVEASPGSASVGSLVVPCHVTTHQAGVMPGHVVTLTAAGFNAEGRFPNLNQATPDTFAPAVLRLRGVVHNPVGFAPNPSAQTFRNQYLIPFGVIVGGVTMPTPDYPQTVQVCVSGLCVARMRIRFDYFQESIGGYFVQPAMLRNDTDSSENLCGALESTDSGIARLLYSVPMPARVSSEGAGSEPADRTDVTWAVVLL